MEITKVIVNKVNADKLKGYATIVLDDCLEINNIKIERFVQCRIVK